MLNKEKVVEFLKAQDWKKISLYASIIGLPLGGLCMFTESFIYGLLFMGISFSGCASYLLDKYFK